MKDNDDSSANENPTYSTLFCSSATEEEIKNLNSNVKDAKSKLDSLKDKIKKNSITDPVLASEVSTTEQNIKQQ